MAPGKMLNWGPIEKYFLRAAVMGELISLAAPGIAGHRGQTRAADLEQERDFDRAGPGRNDCLGGGSDEPSQ